MADATTETPAGTGAAAPTPNSLEGLIGRVENLERSGFQQIPSAAQSLWNKIDGHIWSWCTHIRDVGVGVGAGAVGYAILKALGVL